MDTARYLDAAKKALGIESDYALAKHLGVTTSRIGNWRSGRSYPDLQICEKLANILLVKVLQVTADIEIERARDRPEQQRIWRTMRDAAVFTLVAIGAATLGMPTPSHAAAGQFDNNLFVTALAMRHNGGRSTHCKRFLARALAWLRGWL